MENIKNKIDNNTKIETLLLKINNQKDKDEQYCKGQEVFFSSIDSIILNIVELQNLFHNYNKLNEISMKILESNLKKNVSSFSNSIKLNDDLIDSHKLEIDNKLSKINVIDNRIYKNSDKIYKINKDLNYLYMIQFILVLGFSYLLSCRLF
jgi:hypothetical protein